MNKLTLSRRDCKFGAPMGRANELPTDTNSPSKLQMEKLKWVDGDYTKDGTYWGHGDNNIYCAFGGEESVKIFVRAMNRQDAKDKVRGILPNVKFYV